MADITISGYFSASFVDYDWNRHVDIYSNDTMKAKFYWRTSGSVSPHEYYATGVTRVHLAGSKQLVVTIDGVRVSSGAAYTYYPVGGETIRLTATSVDIENPKVYADITTRRSYTISYSTEHDTAPSSVSDVTELTSAMLPTLTATGYVFQGWYYESTFTTQAQAGDTISANTTLYAKWEEQTVSTLDVTYNGSKIIDSLSVTPPVTVSYGGSTIATLNEGDTKTLDILGEDNKPKILSTPIVIGDKTISDVDALGRKWVFEHNLEIEVGGATPTGETWVINDVLVFDGPVDVSAYVSFESNGNRYTRFYVPDAPRPFLFDDLSYDDNTTFNPVHNQTNGWTDEAYRTITLDEPATGDLLTWLQSNAVKQ